MALGSYGTILADPPWSLGDAGQSVRPHHLRSAQSGRAVGWRDGRPYREVFGADDFFPVMAEAEICALRVQDLAADDCVLWLWSLNSTMEAAYRVTRSWGFVPRGLVTWCKRGPGAGHQIRVNTEQLIIATRGAWKKPEVPALSTWYIWPRDRKHTKQATKPAESYELIEGLSPRPRLELFARRVRPGWTAWGNEVESELDLV